MRASPGVPGSDYLQGASPPPLPFASLWGGCPPQTHEIYIPNHNENKIKHLSPGRFAPLKIKAIGESGVPCLSGFAFARQNRRRHPLNSRRVHASRLQAYQPGGRIGGSRKEHTSGALRAPIRKSIRAEYSPHTISRGEYTPPVPFASLWGRFPPSALLA